MGDLQDPEMEVPVLYHIFDQKFCWDIHVNIGLKNRPNIYGIGTSNQSVPEMASE
jgi:hypothetical protein